MSRQHQGELMQFAWLQLPDIFDLVEAMYEGAVCCHLSGPSRRALSQLSAATPVMRLG